MNNYELDQAAREMAMGKTQYQLARELILAIEKIEQIEKKSVSIAQDLPFTPDDTRMLLSMGRYMAMVDDSPQCSHYLLDLASRINTMIYSTPITAVSTEEQK